MAAVTPRVAAQNPAKAKPCSPESAMSFNGVQRVGGTGGGKAAGSRWAKQGIFQGRQNQAVESNRQYKEMLERVHRLGVSVW